MANILAKLRSHKLRGVDYSHLMREAADEIESLRKEASLALDTIQKARRQALHDAADDFEAGASPDDIRSNAERGQ